MSNIDTLVMDEDWAMEVCHQTSETVAKKEAASLAAGVGGSSTGPPPYLGNGLKRTRTWALQECKAAKVDEKQMAAKSIEEEQKPETAGLGKQRPAPETSDAKPAAIAEQAVAKREEMASPSEPNPSAHVEPLPAPPQTPVAQGEGAASPAAKDFEKPARPVLVDTSQVISPEEQNKLAKKPGKGRGKKKKMQSESDAEIEEDGDDQEGPGPRKPKAKAKAKAKATAKAKAKGRAKAKAKGRPKAKSSPAAGTKAKQKVKAASSNKQQGSAKSKSKPQKKKPVEDNDGESDTQHYSPSHDKKPEAKRRGRPSKALDPNDAAAQRKAKLSRKSSAYQKARSEALRQGKTAEAATAAGKRVTWYI